MKKKVLSLLLVAAMGISMLVGCGGGQTSGGNNTEQKPGTEQGSENKGPVDITLTVWAPENQLKQADGSEGVLLKQMAAFAEANKDKWNIKWEYAAVGEDKLYTEISTDPKVGADVFFYAADQTAVMVEQGIIAQLGGSTKEMVEKNL